MRCGPSFLVLTVLYWSIAAPRAGGIAVGWISGLALDIFQGSVLGQHALALSLVTYIAVREHQKIRSKPVFQQSLIVMGELVIYEFVVFAIDGWTGHALYRPAALAADPDRRGSYGPSPRRSSAAATRPDERAATPWRSVTDGAGRAHQGPLEGAAPL